MSANSFFFHQGSVNGANSGELAKQEDIDGFLVGGASLKVSSGHQKALYCINKNGWNERSMSVFSFLKYV